MQKPHEELWITGATIVTQNSRRSIVKSNLRVVRGEIVALTTRTPPRLAKVVTADGLVLIPGFVQTHVHLCQTLFRNYCDDMELLDWLKKRIWPMEAAHSSESMYTSAAVGIMELLASGTTTILDMGTIRHTTQIFEAARDLGIRANIGKCLMDHSSCPSYLREPMKPALKEVQQLHEKWHESQGGRLRSSLAPRFVLSCSDELLLRVAEISKEWKVLIHTHGSENSKEIDQVQKRFGTSNIHVLQRFGLTNPRLVMAHGIWLEPKEIEILKRSRSTITHCPSSNLKLASGIAAVPHLRKKGVLVSLGADGAPCNNNLNMFQEMRLASLIQKPLHGPRSMKAQEVLDMATRDGAKALHWSDQIGTIEPGKRADFALVDLKCENNFARNGSSIVSSLVYACMPQHVRATYVDGICRYKERAWPGIKGRELLRSFEREQMKIARKFKS